MSEVDCVVEYVVSGVVYSAVVDNVVYSVVVVYSAVVVGIVYTLVVDVVVDPDDSEGVVYSAVVLE